MEIGGVAEDQIDPESYRHSFGVQGVFNQRLNFRWLEELLEGVAAGENAITESADVIVSLLPGDEG